MKANFGRRLLAMLAAVSATMPVSFGSTDVCRSPTDSCMNPDNYQKCMGLMAYGCSEILVHEESCPLQFECNSKPASPILRPRQRNLDADSSSHEKSQRRTAQGEAVNTITRGQEAALAFFIGACVGLTAYIAFLHRELARVTMYRLLSPLLSHPSPETQEEEKATTDGVELTYSIPEINA